MKNLIMKQKNSGITLIALVITIIVLIILASVSINILLGENGILRRSKTAAMEYKISDYIEKVELARGKVSIDHEGVAPLDDLIDQIYEDKIVPEGSITKLSDEVAEMVTPEGYIFIITADKTEYIGKGKGLEGNLIIGAPVWDATTHTASVTIIKGSEVDENLIVEYQINGYTQGWETGTIVSNLKHNDVLYTRLTDGTTAGQYTVRVIKDSLEPQDASIELSGVPAGTTSTATAKVTLMDNESGVDISKCKWIYTNKEDEIGLEPNNYENTFRENEEELSLKKTVVGTYYLHILTQDVAGNRKETISEAIQLNNWITEITIDKQNITMQKGETDTLTVTSILPEDATNKKLEWSNSNPEVATIGEDGTVTALANGTTTISVTATDGSGVKADCVVTVVPALTQLPAATYVYYPSSKGNILCRVLYTKSSSYGLQILSQNSLGNVTIGKYSGYNSSVGTLNSAVSAYNNSSYSNVARSIGTDPNSYTTFRKQSSQASATDPKDTDYNTMRSLRYRK